MTSGNGKSMQQASISIFLSTFFGSDQGPDEKAADSLLNNDFTCNVFVWKIRQYCLEHTIHLMVKQQLKRMGTWWWSVLAQTIILWRLHPFKMYQATEEILPGQGTQLCSALPHRPLRGRWGDTICGDTSNLEISFTR